MNPTPYLFFNGNCAEALATYTDILGGEVEMTMLAGDGPPDFSVSEEQKDSIMHATLKVGEGHLMMSDSFMEPSDPMNGSSVMLSFDTKEKAAEVFAKLATGGEETMPFAPTFWSAGFGTLTDKFGIKWMVGTDQPPA